MFKTFALLTLAAVIASPAAASEVRISLVGKDEATLKAEIRAAANAVCADTERTSNGLYFQRLCISETIKDTQSKIDAAKSAMADAPEKLASR